MFVDWSGGRQIEANHVQAEGASASAVRQSISNLVRLGILDWKEKVYDERELAKFVGRANYGHFIRPDEVPQLVVKLVNDVQAFKNELIKELRGQHNRQRLEVTEFGRNFIASVIIGNA